MQYVLSLTSHTLGKPGLEGSFKHHETCSVIQMEFISNKVGKGRRRRGGREGEGEKEGERGRGGREGDKGRERGWEGEREERTEDKE